MKKILIINGPNLNLLGKREPDTYGDQSFDEFFSLLEEDFPHFELHAFQSNVEGELINKLHEVGFNFDAIIFNAGGYTHTSVAIHDALKILKIPIIELHITNIYNREEFRHKSLISKIATSILCGFGTDGYIMSLHAMNNYLKK